MYPNLSKKKKKNHSNSFLLWMHRPNLVPIFHQGNMVPMAKFFASIFLLIPFAFADVGFNYPAIFNFGDSNSDTGVRIAAGLETLEPPNGETYFRQPAGRFCDGRLIIDFLSNLSLLYFNRLWISVLSSPKFSLLHVCLSIRFWILCRKIEGKGSLQCSNIDDFSNLSTVVRPFN